MWGAITKYFHVFVNKHVFDVVQCLKLLKCSFRPAVFQKIKNFNFQGCELREIKVSDGQVLMIFCSKMERFLKM